MTKLTQQGGESFPYSRQDYQGYELLVIYAFCLQSLRVAASDSIIRLSVKSSQLRDPETESSEKLLSEDMAPSSLKKMSGVEKMNEGNYASLEKSLCATFVNSDLGLTLFPGSQIQRKDEKQLGTAAESSPGRAGMDLVDRTKKWTPPEAETRATYPTHETACPNQLRNPCSSPSTDPTRLLQLTARINRERPFSQILTERNDSGLVQRNDNHTTAAPYNEHRLSTIEVGKAKSCQHDDYSSRVIKWRRLGTFASNGLQKSKVSEAKESAYETLYNGSHVHYDQDQGLSGNSAIQPGSKKRSFAMNGIAFSKTEGEPGSSKPEPHCLITRSPRIAFACVHQGTVFRSEDTTSHSESPTTVAFAPGSPIKHQHSEPEQLPVHYRSRNPSKVSTQRLKHSSLLSDSPANIKAQVLKVKKGVNRSWTSHFPANAEILRRANFPGPYFLAVPFTPTQDRQFPHFTSALLTSTNFRPYTNLSSTPPSASPPKYCGLSKAFPYLSDVGAPEDIFNTTHTTHAGNQRQSARRRSSSMPNLCSSSAPTNMAFSNNFGPPSTPTPPLETQSSRAFSKHPSSLPQYDNAAIRQNLVGPPRDHADTSSNANISFSRGPMVAERLQHSRRPLEVKSNYSHEEVKSLVFHHFNKAQNLSAENTSLMSSNIAMKKGIDSLRSERADLIKQIERYELIIMQKDRQIGSMQQTGSWLQQQHKQIYDQYHQLITVIRKEDGTGNPSAIAQTIKRNYIGNTIGANAEGTNPLQAVPIHTYPGADLAKASSRPSVQPTLATVSQNKPNPPHNASPGRIQSNHSLSPPVPTVITNVQNSDRPIGHVSTEHVTIDLTNEPQPPLSSALCDTSIHQTGQSAVQGGNLPSDTLVGHYPLAQSQVHNCEPRQYPSAPSAQNQSSQSQSTPKQDSQSTDREAMRIQRETLARMANKPLSWLQGENPFRKGTKTSEQVGLSGLRQPAQNNEEQLFILTESPETGSVAPLPKSTSNRQAKAKALKKPKIVLTAEAKKQRQRGYRKTAADKKRREREVAKQLLRGENTNNALCAQKQDRRATKGEKRQEQARKSSGEFRPRESQKTLDGRPYQGITGVQQAVPRGSIEEVPSDDHDSIFEDDEDDQMEMEGLEPSSETDSAMHENDATLPDGVDSAYAAELEALLSADGDVGTPEGVERNDMLGSEDNDPDVSCESEESEEE